MSEYSITTQALMRNKAAPPATERRGSQNFVLDAARAKIAAEFDQIASRLNQGEPFVDVSRDYAVQKDTFYAIIMGLGFREIEHPHRKQRMADYKMRVRYAAAYPKMLALCEQGYGGSTIARKMGMNFQSFKRLISVFDLPVTANRVRAAAAAAAQDDADKADETAFVRVWIEREDAKVRRGHYCGFAPASVGAQIERSALSVMKRAQDLGLGVWPPMPPARIRNLRARDYDANIPAESKYRPQPGFESSFENRDD